MKYILKIVFIISCIALSQQGYAQLHISNNTTVSIKQNGTVQVLGDFFHNGLFINKGSFYVNGNVVSNGTSGYNGGTLLLTGASAQSISGALPLQTTKLTFNNPAGIILNTTLSVDEQVVFTNGMVTASNQASPLELLQGATVSGASEDSHVNGYVRALGTGNVVFPVGCATSYKPAWANITANGQGLTATYIEGNGGSADYTAGYNSEILADYNAAGYWDIRPATTALATLTLTYDNSYGAIASDANYADNLKVAHYQNGEWHSEGGIVSGNQTSGTVTSQNVISSWSPFTVGLIQSSVLPVRWISFDGKLDDNNHAKLDWKLDQTNVADYQIERSSNASDFRIVGKVDASGDGVSQYGFTDPVAAVSTVYYRIRQTDLDGSFSYSRIISLTGPEGVLLMAYPNPTGGKVTVQVSPEYLGTWLKLVNSSGILVKQVELKDQTLEIPLDHYPAGIYIIYSWDGRAFKIIKN